MRLNDEGHISYFARSVDIGRIPEGLASLTKLTVLRLYNNELNGESGPALNAL